MRGKRAKQYRKLMALYTQSFSFRDPYQILLSTSTLLTAHASAMDLPLLLARSLQGALPPKLLITQCSMRALYALPAATHPEKQPLIEFARSRCERRRCGHHTLEDPLAEDECLREVVAGKGGGGGGNSNRYVLVTQDEELRRWGRGVRGLPMLYIRRSVLIMEPMSGVSRGAVGARERAKLKEGIRGARGLKRAREPEEETEEEEVDGSVEADGEEGVTAPHQEEPRAPKDRASGDAQSRPVRKTKKQYGFKKSKVK